MVVLELTLTHSLVSSSKGMSMEGMSLDSKNGHQQYVYNADNNYGYSHSSYSRLSGMVFVVILAGATHRFTHEDHNFHMKVMKTQTQSPYIIYILRSILI